MASEVGILSAAVELPTQRQSVQNLFDEERVNYSPATLARLGIEQVPLSRDERGSALALAACRKALESAGVSPADLDFIVDYTILPQEWLVPAWNMSNKLQFELGASKAFTVGLSGGGATNFLVSLSFGTAMLSDDKMKYGLLVAADVTIPGNRVLNRDGPVSVMGDAGSAVVLGRGEAGRVILDVELWSDGTNHDVCFIPGGGLAHPESPDLYRLVLDKPRYDAAPKTGVLVQLTRRVLERAFVQLDDVSRFIYPNISADDRTAFMEALGLRADRMCVSNRKAHGHLQGTDLVLNYLSALENGSLSGGSYMLMASHGGATRPARDTARG